MLPASGTLVVNAKLLVGDKGQASVRYRLNDKNLTHKDLVDLCRAVGLNVDDETFMVQQNRVIEICMKSPKELAALFCSAFGTQTFLDNVKKWYGDGDGVIHAQWIGSVIMGRCSCHIQEADSCYGRGS